MESKCAELLSGLESARAEMEQLIASGPALEGAAASRATDRVTTALRELRSR